MIRKRFMIQDTGYSMEGHPPSLKSFRLQLRGIVLRSQKRFSFAKLFSHLATEESFLRSSNVSRSKVERKHFGEGGQSITEYAMFIAVMVMALLAMQIYLKRGLQGKIKDMADQISPALYNPNTTESNFSTNTSSFTNSSYIKGLFRQDIIYESTNRTGTEVVYPEVL